MLAIGVFIGFLLTILALQVPEISPPAILTKELFATLVGAGIALCGTYWTIADIRKSRQNDDRNRENGEAISVFFKLQTMFNQVSVPASRIRETHREVYGTNNGLGQMFAPSAYIPNNIYFSHSERALFLMRREEKILGYLADAHTVHNNFMESLRQFRDLKMDLMDGVPAKMNGTVGLSEVDQKTYDQIAPKIVVVNSLAEQILERTEVDLEYLRVAANLVLDYLKREGIVAASARFSEVNNPPEQ